MNKINRKEDKKEVEGIVVVESDRIKEGGSLSEFMDDKIPIQFGSVKNDFEVIDRDDLVFSKLSNSWRVRADKEETELIDDGDPSW